MNVQIIKPVYVNAKTGEVARTIDISEFAGSLTNFYCTADDSDNILFVNLTPGGGSTFTIWRTKGVNAKPEKYIEFSTTAAMGRKISLQVVWMVMLLLLLLIMEPQDSLHVGR
ncbi:DUF5018 domain-containing protein [Bacteroides faecis]|nr:DUF5018 domain-containing protein [Bacteroides faecis]MCS3327207.1 DUF5018 domain-containing protein [Bacteroides faecis]